METTNFDSYCRICLDIKSKHVSIFNDPLVHVHIKSCLSITVSQNDNLPKSICESCLSQLDNFYNFQLNARFSQDWLETCVQDKKKATEIKTLITPLPDSEYNSDSLLDFLNSTANIEEYLNNLGKEDIPVIVNMLDRTEGDKFPNKVKISSPKKRDTKHKAVDMDIDVLDSDIDIVKEILMKESKPKNDNHSCFACKEPLDSIETLSRHLSICDSASRTCVLCNTLFDSKQKMLQHLLTHNITAPLTCTCGRKFENNEKLLAHTKYCNIDHIASMGFMYRCRQCKETFTERFQLFKHAKKHVLQAEQRVCDICGFTFTGSEALNKHKKLQHNKPNNLQFKCKLCHFLTVNRKEMYNHVQKHAHIKSKHLCESCGRCFSSRLTLLRHSLQHSETYRCTTCSKVFVDKKKRDGHIMSEHIELVMCEKCGQSINSIELNKHNCRI